mgnify:CR=1 FL=1
MASKKYFLFIGLFCMMVSGAFAQTISAYDMRDSSLYSAKHLPQHNEFGQNAYAFPAKPRNQWELGIKAGTFTIFGDVPAVFPTFAGGIHVRKALGYVFSLRGEFMYGIGKGLNWKPRSAGFSDPVIAAGYNTPGRLIYDNYKAKVKDLNLQGIFTLNNIRFHRATTGFTAYALVGFGATWYNTTVNLNNGGLYDYSSIAGGNYKNRKDTRKALKDRLDDSYETEAENDGDARPQLGDNTLRVNVQAGAGLAFKLSKKVNLAIENRITVPLRDDLMDGQRWQNAGANNARVLSPDYDTYNFLSVGLNINLGNKAVEPLWWINPLDYAYNEINQPKHMKLPKPVLDDSDNDGVTDQFDQEPNTPAGAPVDTHGVSRDTDGDGVPDFRDKELITPTQCQPVDADGVGKCPDPTCCADLKRYIDSLGLKPGNGCGIGDLPSITFSGRSVTLSNDAKALLASVAQKLRANPTCKIAVIGYGESSKAAQQLSWDRVNAVINYLVEKEGISADRFIFQYGKGEGDENTVDLRDGTNEEGPNTVPAPHPNLRRRG